MITTMLCASVIRLRIRMRMENTKNGIRTDRTTPSASVNVVHASDTIAARKPHRTCDSARNGR